MIHSEMLSTLKPINATMQPMKLLPLIGLFLLSTASSLAQSRAPQLICNDRGSCRGGCSGPDQCNKIKIIQNNFPFVTHYSKTSKHQCTSQTNCQKFNGRINHTLKAVDGVSIEDKWTLQKPGSIGFISSGTACLKA